MDEEVETVDRREAVRGLSLLGALVLAVGASVVYRIVAAGPANNPGPPLIAVSPPEPSTADDIPATVRQPAVAASKGPAARQDEQVQRAAFAEEAPAEAEASSPRFVAPGDPEAKSAVPPLAPPFEGGEAPR